MLILTSFACLFAGGTLLLQVLDRRTNISIVQEEGFLDSALSVSSAQELRFIITNAGAHPVKIQNVRIKYKPQDTDGNEWDYVNPLDMPGLSPFRLPFWLDPRGGSYDFHAD